MKKLLLVSLLAALCLPIGARAEEAPIAATPRAVKTVSPEYPQQARERGIEGSVVISCIVDAGGQILAVGTLDNEHPDLAKAALAAVQQWEFAPLADRQGRPYMVRIPVNFELSPSIQQVEVMNIAAR